MKDVFQVDTSEMHQCEDGQCILETNDRWISCEGSLKTSPHMPTGRGGGMLRKYQ